MEDAAYNILSHLYKTHYFRKKFAMSELEKLNGYSLNSGHNF